MFDKLTDKDIKDMETEIAYRKSIVRQKLIKDVQEARAHGDLSENFEYYAAKKEKNKNESRINYLEKMIKTAVIVDDRSAENQVGLNKVVTLHIEEDDCDETYRLTTTVRGNSLSGLITNESPLGKAIIGKYCGDRVYVKVDSQYGYYVVIKDVKPAENDGSDTIRDF